MDINLTPEALLSQLGYTNNEQTITQINKIIENTNGYKKISKHLLGLHDQLAHIKGFIALSNSKDFFKIKCSEDVSSEINEEFLTLVQHWANKYKVNIEKVENKSTFYIIGQ